MRKNDELMLKYYDLWGATLLNLVTQAGIDPELIKKTDEIVKNAIKKPQDVMFHHKKLTELRSA